MLASRSILAESTRHHKRKIDDGDINPLSDVIIRQTFFTEESLHRSNKLLDLLQLFISDFWIREDFILKKKQITFQ